MGFDRKKYMAKYNRDHNNKEDHCNRQRKYSRTPSARWRTLRHAAKLRGLMVSIGFSDFDHLTKLPCSYCGLFGPGIDYVGLDRVDNSQGYLPTNVVPCCTVCNRMKHILSREDFFIHLERVLSYSG